MVKPIDTTTLSESPSADLRERFSSVATPPFAYACGITPVGQKQQKANPLKVLMSEAAAFEAELERSCRKSPLDESIVTMSEEQADAIRRKLADQSGRLATSEQRIESQQKKIDELTGALSKSQAPNIELERSAKKAEAATKELAAARMEVHEVRQQMDSKDQEIELLLPQVLANRVQCSDRMKSKDAEIDRLRNELLAANSQFRQAQALAEEKTAELNRILPEFAASKKQTFQEAEINELRKELETVRAEVARKEVELLRVDQDVSTNNRSSSDIVRRLQDKDAEIARLRCELSMQQGADFIVEGESCGAGVNRQGADDFQDACANFEKYLIQREQNLEAREARCAREQSRFMMSASWRGA